MWNNPDGGSFLVTPQRKGGSGDRIWRPLSTRLHGFCVVAMALALATTATATSAASGPAATAPTATSSAAKIVVRAKFKSMKQLTITYTSNRGTYSATWIGMRHYRLSGTINGRHLSGTIRTRPSSDGDSYVAKGSGKLGSRSVRIGGGGPNTLKTATLILS
jgi:hypothetical protein